MLSSAYQGPAHIPLPDSPDRDLRDPSVIAECRGYAPAIKIGGVRHKTTTRAMKGKGKENTDMNGGNLPQKCALEDEDELRTKRGRPNSSNNYSSEDVKALLDLVQDVLPLGQKGWQEVHSKFTQWATRHDRPHRKAQSLETKFKQVSSTLFYNGVLIAHIASSVGEDHKAYRRWSVSSRRDSCPYD